MILSSAISFRISTHMIQGGMSILNDVAGKILSFDHRNRWFAIGRTGLALGPLMSLLVTPAKAFVVPVALSPSGANCENIRAYSVLCLGGYTGIDSGVRHWILIAIYIAVAIGFYPRWTSLLHIWAAFTMSVSITLPDGGDAIGLIISLLLAPMCLGDRRRWVWTVPNAAMSPSTAAFAWVSNYAIRIQLAYIYLDSSIAKFGVEDWRAGTAEYYILRDTVFGASGPLKDTFLWLSDRTLGVVALTWGALVIEIAIGLLLLGSPRWRLFGWFLDILLHVAIILTMGLFSFAGVMMSSATIAANPAVPGTRRASVSRQSDESVASDSFGESEAFV